jgi:hypothetical protein
MSNNRMIRGMSNDLMSGGMSNNWMSRGMSTLVSPQVCISVSI